MEKRTIIIGMFLLLVSNVFADDVQIDSNGNVKTGVAGAGNLEVTGASAEKAIVGQASGTGGSGVYGINTTSGNYGYLGWDTYGVYGYNPSGWAGYFSGNARVTGDLTVDGTILGPVIGDITGVIAGTGLTGGATSGEATLNADTTYLQRRVSGICPAGSSISTINANGTELCETDDAGTGVGGSGTVNYIPKWTGSTSLGDSAIYQDGSGNVGIGTSSPEMKFQVTGGAMKIGDNGGWAPNSIQFEPQSGFHRIAFSDLRFYDRVMGGDNVIFKNGNVGIGTTAPTSRLTVAGTIETTSGGVKYPDGTVQNSAITTPPTQNPRANTITTVESAGDVGYDTSITIGTDGLPVISYFDFTNYDLKVAKCANQFCVNNWSRR